MSDVIKTGLELTFVFLFILGCLYIRYRFPHFSMHFFDGISKFGINSFDFERKCNTHNKQDIERYKKRQWILFTVMLMLFVGTLLFYIVSHLLCRLQ